jgi:hypothetical protein
MKTQHHKTRSLALGLALICLAGSAVAQWQWLEADGRKIFSDKAPPPSVPESQILRDGNGHPYVPVGKAKAVQDDKAPTYGFKEFKPAPSVSPAPKAALAQNKPQATKTPKAIEQEKKAQADQAAKAAEEKRKVQERQDANCKTIRGSLAGLDSGRRLSTFNEKGDRNVMSDADRTAERQRLEAGLKENQCQ